MKKIFTSLFSVAILLSGVAQNTTGLSPAFKFGAANTTYDKSYGFINETGKLVVPYDYDSATDFVNGFSVVSKNNKYGFVDETGKLVIPCEYDDAAYFSDGIARVTIGDSSFYIDKSGKKLEGNTKIDGLTQIEVNQRYGFTDKSGELIIPAEYYWRHDIFGNYIVCRYQEKYHVYDVTGKLILETFKTILDISEGYVIYNENSIHGVMDLSGNVLFESKEGVQGTLRHYSGEYFYAYDDGKNIYLDKTGKVIEMPKPNDGMPYIRSEIVKGNYLANIYDGSGKLIKSYDYDPGVEGDNLKFIHGLARINLIKEDKSSKDQLVRDWGGIQTVYVNLKGEIVWKSDVFYSCFPPEALITMSNGTQKKISDVKAGEFILSYDFQLKKEINSRVETVLIHTGNYSLMEIEAVNPEKYTASLTGSFQEDLKLVATPNHPVYTSSGIKPVSELQEGDEIITLAQNGNLLQGKVTQKEISENSISTVYNLKTSSSCYFVNGILVMMK